MDEQAWVKKLEQEGYMHVAVCQNGANSNFGEHTHEKPTVHVILQGQLILTEEEVEKTYNAGDRLEIAPETTHDAKCGPEGCKFVVGVKRA